MSKKLMNTLETPDESSMRDLLQRAYKPRRLSSFEEALRGARERQQGRRRVVMASAVLVVLSSLLYAYWPSMGAARREDVRLNPVPVKAPDVAVSPAESATRPAAALQPKAEGLGWVYGPLNLRVKDGEGKPLHGLRVEVDGELTNYETPLTEPGIPLAPGAHHLVFRGEGEERYGPYWVEIEAGTALFYDFSMLVTPPSPLILDGKEITPTKTQSATGTLVLNTFPLIGLTVSVDGKSTGKKTPVASPGIELSAGKHKLEFIGTLGERHGPYWVTIRAGEETRQRVDLREAEPRVGDNTIPLDGEPVTKRKERTSPVEDAPAKTGFLVVSTSAKPGLRVFVDGVDTREKTPMKSPGLTLSVGKHSLSFRDEKGNDYGSYTVIITAGATTRNNYATKKTPTSAPKVGDNALPL